MELLKLVFNDIWNVFKWILSIMGILFMCASLIYGTGHILTFLNFHFYSNWERGFLFYGIVALVSYIWWRNKRIRGEKQLTKLTKHDEYRYSK